MFKYPASINKSFSTERQLTHHKSKHSNKVLIQTHRSNRILTSLNSNTYSIFGVLVHQFILNQVQVYSVCFHKSRWLVLSSRPATSFIGLVPVVRKSSYPSPPEIISMQLELLSVFDDSEILVFRFSGAFSSISTEVRKRTCPVCPWGIPKVESISFCTLSAWWSSVHLSQLVCFCQGFVQESSRERQHSFPPRWCLGTPEAKLLSSKQLCAVEWCYHNC